MDAMKRRNRIRISLFVAAVLFGIGSWSGYRAIRQANLNRQLITAIKQSEFQHSRANEVLACLKRGADPNARDEPYDATFSWNHLLILMGLRKNTNPPAQTAVLLALEGEMKNFRDSATHHMDPDVVKALLRYGANVRTKDRYGRTPLIAAFSPIPRALWPAHGGIGRELQGECELALIAAGADVEAFDEDGVTALMKSFDYENANELEAALLHRGADVNAHPKAMTALLYRASCQDKAGCRFLLEHGANVNATQDGHTALTYAAEVGDDALVNLLLQHGADVNPNIGRGKTPLMAAAEGHCSTMRILLQHGAVVEAQDLDGWTALTLAAQEGNEACVRLLLDRGATVTNKYKDGNTLYQLIKEKNGTSNRAMIRLLKEHGMKE
ncbi:MAG: kinesin light chain [Chthonomonadaceae bacterium]|nr:kinesin light chain [Chthonomonadaceae bacterium]